jgi:hypothetical protein
MGKTLVFGLDGLSGGVINEFDNTYNNVVNGISIKSQPVHVTGEREESGQTFQESR